MDLVASVRKEGSRGGRDAFKWSDVKDSSHRENYLGHSLMAPVGRWQQGRDLSWYAKHNDEDSADAVKKEKEAELQRIKEAEQEAMARALGLPVAPKSATGANATAVSGRDVEKLIKESTSDANETEAEIPKGIGFGGYNGLKHAGDDANADRLEAVGMSNDTKRKEPREKRSDDVEINRRRDRPRDRSRERGRFHDRKERSHRYENGHDRHERRRYRPRSPTHARERRRSRSRDRDRRRTEDYRRSRRERSRSPENREDDRRRADNNGYRRRR
ncbi:hypothetical protein D8B26_007243 [Coccidioides posadasii str. Silveira]|uniref:Uncharacterized protein n=2 Tax=Coccidioides posadasii TaxID=199306 RepID=E9D365_COCPS|nr:hypothetical protein CPC735_012880 [Coccidioides posadasii C735 delta SOWgp]EER29970.1 hypothetical protein CPC735_012880 [Coccidioides posadasii C735 delta SOWgp]EFW19060.1 conserved hypothetical protein [Coccidioides posadasii str. Silveira]QVM12624.1 hypothetical protein D8B26_007243 [Coccidioides posadasii str. Silveira]|eukprot:XP_003072115.1 hypothetical protein CPC735_012880 [Coccidioides posadasii C735 delta SOWgp]